MSGQKWLETLKNVPFFARYGFCLPNANEHLSLPALHQFVNTDEQYPKLETIEERGQLRPADWSPDSAPKKYDISDIKGGAWEWRNVMKVKDLDPSSAGCSSAAVKYSDSQIAVFKVSNGKLYATQHACPHNQAFVLADGIISDTDNGKAYVSCPLHK